MLNRKVRAKNPQLFIAETVVKHLRRTLKQNKMLGPNELLEEVMNYAEKKTKRGKI